MQNQFHLSVDGEILISQSDNFDPDESEGEELLAEGGRDESESGLDFEQTFTHRDWVFDQDFNDNESADLEQIIEGGGEEVQDGDR